jgi:hypothetical protein
VTTDERIALLGWATRHADCGHVQARLVLALADEWHALADEVVRLQGLLQASAARVAELEGRAGK